MNGPPDPESGAQLVRETDERPVVRDSQDNPVVRFRDLEKVKSELKDEFAAAYGQLEAKVKIGFAVIGAIGVANLLGIKRVDTEIPSTLAQAISRLIT